jgi:vancomycin resistance protein YoaR
MLVVLLAALGIGLGIYASSHQNRIYGGVSVAGVDLGGKTRSQARAALDPVLNEFLAQPITLTSQSGDFTLDPRTSGIAFDIDATVERAFTYGRSGNIVGQFARWSRALLHGSSIKPVLALNDEALNAALSDVADQVIVPPVNAAIVFAGDAGPAIATEWPGVGFDLTETRHLLADHLATLSTGPVPLVLIELEPDIARVDLETGLATAQVVITEGFVIRGPERRIWQLDRDDLRALMSFAADDGRLSLNDAAIGDLVAGLAQLIDRESVNATVFVNDDEEVVIRRSVDALEVDQDASIEAILAALLDGAGEASIVFETVPAEIQTDVAESVAARIEGLIEDGLGLTWDDGSERLTRRELLAALTLVVEPGGDEPFTIGFDRSVLTAVITPIVAPLESDVRNAQLRVVDGAITVITSSEAGVEVDVDATVAAVQSAALAGEDAVPVVLTRVEPDVTDADAASITLDDQLATGSTAFVNATDSRRSNIALGAELIDGIMIAPGATFSFLDAIGEISDAQGFETAFGMVYDAAGGATPGLIVGGGLSQVSTTLFQAAFWAGLSIEERTAHPFWIEAYGQPPSGMVGLDAMVDVRPDGSIDFTFTNSTEHWIVISTEVSTTALTVEITGTNPGWTVRADEPVISSRIELIDDEAIVIEADELASGSERIMDAETDGFTVTIVRTVTRGETIVSEDDFVSSFAPSPGIVLRGESTSPADD